MDGTEQGNKVTEPNKQNFDLFRYLHSTFNNSVNNKAMTFWSWSNSETLVGVLITWFILFLSLALIRFMQFLSNAGFI